MLSKCCTLAPYHWYSWKPTRDNGRDTLLIEGQVKVYFYSPDTQRLQIEVNLCAFCLQTVS